MSVQMELSLLPPTPQALSLVGVVRQVLLEHDWITPWALQNAVMEKGAGWHSDSSLTARIRELRREDYGHHVISKRRRENGSGWEYRLEA